MAKSAETLQQQLSDMSMQLQLLVANRRAAGTEANEEQTQHERPEASPPDPKRAKADDLDGDAVFGDALEEAPAVANSTAGSSPENPRHLEAIKKKAKDRQAALETATGAAEDATKRRRRVSAHGGKNPPPPEQRV